MNIDINAMLEQWKRFLRDLGAIEATKFEQTMRIVRQQSTGKMEELGPRWMEEYTKLATRLDSLTEDEYLRFQTDYYAAIHKNWFAALSIADQTYIMRRLLEMIAGMEEISGVADIGCGTAVHDIFLSSHGIIEKPIVGIDPLLDSLRQGRELAEQNSVEIDLIEGRITRHDIPLPSDTFQLALAIDSLHWTMHWDNGIREMARILKSGGALFVVYSTHSPRTRINWTNAVDILKKAGMTSPKISMFPAPATATPRVVITAIKQ